MGRYSGLWTSDQPHFQLTKEGKGFLGMFQVDWEMGAQQGSIRGSRRITDRQRNFPFLTELRYLPMMMEYSLYRFQGAEKKYPSPEWVFSATEFLEGEIKARQKVLQFGMNHGSLWMLQRATHLTVLESDMPVAAELMYFMDTEAEDYPSFIKQNLHVEICGGAEKLVYLEGFPDNYFDYLIVDNLQTQVYPEATIALAISKLKKDGWCVLHQSDLPNNHLAVSYLDKHLPSLRFTGFTPIDCFISQTRMWKKV
ncbi:MAG: hypothetical protein AAFY71_26620 [Bacteroidota bacterium]